MNSQSTSCPPSDQIAASLQQINNTVGQIERLCTPQTIDERLAPVRVSSDITMSTQQPSYSKIGKQGRWKVRVVSDLSDGEKRHWPSPRYIHLDLMRII